MKLPFPTLARLLRFLPLLLSLPLSAATVKPREEKKTDINGIRPLDRSSLSTEPGAIYFGELLPEPILIKLPQACQIYYQLNLQRWLGTFAAGEKVKVEAMSDNAWRLRGHATHGDAVGWVPLAQLKLDPTLIEKLKKIYERQKIVSEMIAAKQVGLGMTLPEVKAALGEPTRTSAKLDNEGKKDVVEYAVFEKVPQVQTVQAPDGKLFNTTVYIKVETGNVSITLKDNQVTAIEETKGKTPTGGQVKIVPPPIILQGF